MKISKKLFIASFLLAAILSGITLLNVAAQDNTMTSQQRQRILDNCVLTKNTLNQLHASDALLRVNMGQIYESMSTKLMSGFNARVSNNDYGNADLVSATTKYNSALNTFRTDYKTYEEHLSAAINIDCQKQPVSFYDAVAAARTERTRVNVDIIKLNQFVDEYQSAINQFQTDYLAANDKVRR